MNPIEKAIRGALDKGEAHERAYREQVYRTVYAALERTIASRPDLAPDVVEQRRQAFRAAVRTVETEFLPAAPAQAPASGPEVDFAEPEFEPEPEFELEAGSEPGPEPAWADGRRPEPVSVEPADRGGGEAPAPQAEVRTARRRGRGRVFAALFIGVTLLAGGAIAAWWASDQGLFLSADERGSSVPNPPKLLEDEEFDPEEADAAPGRPGDAGGRSDWITIFTPADISTVTTPGGASAEVVDGDGGSALRIRSEDAETGVLIDVGQGILERIAGRRAMFDIVARGAEGDGPQFSVTCNFGELGGCGRNRYTAGPDRSDFLFERPMPEAAPGAAGTMAIVPDIDGGGRAIDVFEIRVSPGE